MSERSLSPSMEEEFQRLVRTAQLSNLRPKAYSAKLQDDLQASVLKGAAEISADLKVQRRTEGFSVMGRFNCVVRPVAESAHKPLASFQYEVTADYSTGAEEFPPVLLEVYARSAAMMHFWPYFRHFVQTSSAELHLNPPVLLPMFRPESFAELRKQVLAHQESISAEPS